MHKPIYGVSVRGQQARAIYHILTHCGALVDGEQAFIICDETTRQVAYAFERVALDITPLATHTEVFGITHHGIEPPEVVARVMEASDLTISLCQYSLAHTRARQRAKRFLSLPGYSFELLENPAVMVDYEAQAPNVMRFADAFTNGEELRVIAHGCDVICNISGRSGNFCPGFVRATSGLASPPDIEANVAPIEGSAMGEWFDELSMLAECGVGLNPLITKLTGNMLLDEGMFGAVHFGLGSNHTIGGNRDVGWHKDIVMPNASLWVDGIQMLKDGELC